MDGLTIEEKALAWEASWHPSFAGIAIVDKNFRFRSVNPQFCEILGVSPAELIGQDFQDITPPPVKQLDANNARLVIRKVITSYLLPKTYDFGNGKIIKVMLLVKGVYSKEGNFLFFVSRIMLDGSEKSFIQDQKPIGLLDFLSKHGKIFAAIGTGLAAMIIALINWRLK